MRLVIITNGNYFARIILEQTMIEYRESIAGILVVTGIIGGRSRLASLWAILRRSGWQHFLYKAQTYIIFALANIVCPSRAFFVPQLAKRFNVPFSYVEQVRSSEAQKIVEDWQPDLLISVSCPQRIPAYMLQMATCCSINIHSSLLPTYAGISPYIWVLAKGEKVTGTTVHIMEPEFDTGDIIVQKHLQILEHDSVFNLFYRLAQLGKVALSEAIHSLETTHPVLIKQDPVQRTYYSWPATETVRNLYRNGHRLGNILDFWQAIKETH
jgi:folate-dependent phosphoribosylglycinamide formyltransferase PurN